MDFLALGNKTTSRFIWERINRKNKVMEKNCSSHLKMDEFIVFLNNWPTALTVTAASPFPLRIREQANSKVLEFLEIEPLGYTK